MYWCVRVRAHVSVCMRTSLSLSHSLYLSLHARVCVCVCVCACASFSLSLSLSLCVCVCVCVRERVNTHAGGYLCVYCVKITMIHYYFWYYVNRLSVKIMRTLLLVIQYFPAVIECLFSLRHYYLGYWIIPLLSPFTC